MKTEPAAMNARDIEKKAWEDFREWADRWVIDHPDDEDIDIYSLALMYSPCVHHEIVRGYPK